MSEQTITDLISENLDALGVPDCDVRRVAIDLARIVDDPDRPGHAAAASAGLSAVMEYMRELYEPRSPLQVQLDVLRARLAAAREGIPMDDEERE